MAGKYWWEEDEEKSTTETTTQSNTQTEKKYWWEDDATQNTTESKNTGYWWEDHNMAATAGNNIVNRVNKWLNDTNSLYTDYEQRYSGRKYTYEDAYVSDSADWLNTVTERRTALDTERQAILDYIEQYNDYLDSGWAAKIRGHLLDADKASQSILEAATKDNEYWSKWADENAYKAEVNAHKDYTEKVNLDIDAYTKELDDFGNFYDESIGIALWYDDYQRGTQLETDPAEIQRKLGVYNRFVNEFGGNLDAVEDAYKSKEKYLNEAKSVQAEAAEKKQHDQWVAFYNAYTNNADFAEKSAYQSTYRGGEKFNAWAGMYTDTGYDDITYDYINRDETARGRMQVNDIATNASFLGLDTSYLKEMTDDEIAIYNYLYQLNKPQAEEYLAFLLSDLTYRQRKRREEEYAAYAKEHPFLASGFSIVTSPLKSLSALGQVADYLDDGKVDQNAGYNKFSYTSSAIRNQVAADIEKSGNWGKVGSWTYQLGMSMGDFLVNSAVSGGNSAISLALMGSGAMADTVISAKDRGLSDDQAMILGVVAGAAEIVTEKFSVDALFKGDLSKGAMRYILTNAFTEGAEEVSSSLINTVADVLVSKDKSEWEMAIKEYLYTHPDASEKDAFQAVLGDKILSLGLDFLGGALMGGVMGSGGATINYITNARPGIKENIDAATKYGDSTKDLIEQGLLSDPNSDSYDLAQHYKKKTDKGKALSGYEIRNLVEANEAQFATENFQSVARDAKHRLEELGEKEGLNHLADLVAKRATGQELTRSEKSTLANSQFGAKVAKEMRDAKLAEVGIEKTTYKSLEDRVGTESTLKVSENGQATIRETGDVAHLADVEVVSIDNGNMTVRVDGNEVSTEEIDYADDSQSYLFDAVPKIENITPAAATAIIRDYDASTGQTVGEYLNGIDEAYTYGYNNYSVEDLKAGNFAPNLTKEQMMSAYRLGESARKIGDVKDDAPIVKMRTEADAKLSKKEKVAKQKARFDSKNVEVYFEDGGTVVKFEESGKYDEKRMAAVNYAKLLSKLGIGGKGYYFYESYVNAEGVRVYKDANGNEVEAPNGMYRESDGSIHIDLNAGDAGQGTTLFTLGHELTHFIKQWSKAKFKVLADFLIEEYGKTDMSMHERVLEKQKFLEEKRGKAVSYDEAFEEVVADAMSTMLSDGNLHEKLAKLKSKDKDLFNKIKQFFDRLIAKFQALYKDLPPEQQDAIDVRNMKDAFDRIQTAFAEALVEASENFQAAMESVVEAKAEPMSADEIVTDGAVVTDGNGERHSIRSMKHDIADGKMFEDLKNVCGWTDAQVNELRTQLKDLVDYMIPYRTILDMNENYGMEGRRFSPYKPNSDPLYKISMDFSTLCSKRLLTQYVIEQLQLRENRPMSAEEQMAIRDMLNEYRKVEKGLQVACAMCYVEAARLKSPKQIQRWLNDPAPLLRDYFGKKNKAFNDSVKKAQADFKESKGYDREAPKKDMKQADIKELNKIGPKMRSQYQPSAEEQAIIEKAKTLPNSTYLTAGNLADLSETDPVIYDAYTAFVRTATRSKSLEKDEPYYYGDSTRDNGNGIVVTDSFIEAVNKENGMRFSSWSDWRIHHLLDYITAVIDNSVRGAAMHGYTKFGDEIRVLGKTGMMFNMSGVTGTQTGLNEDGSLNFSETESIDVNEAIQLREEFPEHAGLQCIGVSDAHIIALLRSDIIDYVIPYHVSGLNADLRRMAKIYGWDDYTGTQHAAIDKSIKLEDAVDKEHWREEPVFSEFFVGYDTGMTGIEAMRASAEKYKQMCKDRGLIPKFNQFATEDNYWKLLIDRKMINQQTGNLIRQKAVTPTFDFDVIKGVVDKFVDNYDSGLEGRALNHIVENWDSIPQRIKDLKKKGSTKSKKTNKAVNALANQTVAAQPKDEVKNSDRSVKTFKKDQNANGVFVANVLIDLADTSSKWWTGTYNHAILSMSKSDDTEFTQFHQEIEKRTRDMEDYEEQKQSVYDSFTIQDGKGKEFIYRVKLDGYMHGVVLEKVDKAKYAAALMRATKGGQNGKSAANIKGRIRTARSGMGRNSAGNGGNRASNGNPGHGGLGSGSSQGNHAGTNSPGKSANRTVPAVTKKSDRNNAPTFYSKMGKVVEGMKQEKFGASSVISMLTGRGVKAEEIRWSGIHAFLDGKKSVTKAELLEFINGSMLQIEESVRDSAKANNVKVKKLSKDSVGLYVNGKLSETFTKDADDRWWPSNPTDSGDFYLDSDHILDEYSDTYGNKTRWSEYKLKGGKNYREMTFKIPQSTYSNQSMQAHWGNKASGILAHARMQDFKVNGKRMLFIEEIQSDWHNAGAKHGYFIEGEKATKKDTEVRHENGWYNLYRGGKDLHQGVSEAFLKQHFTNGITEEEIHEGLVDEYNRAVEHSGKGWKASDAPFKGNYHEYVLKRLLRMAAEEGYDSIGWTTADIQSDRWSDDYAEGYRIEYDQDIPKFLKKYGKQWDTNVGKTELDNGTEVWSMAITDPMKKSVLTEGQEMYSERATKIATDFANHMENIVKTKHGWYARDVFKYVEEHPELGFIEAIKERSSKDKEVKNLLEEFLNGVDDVKALEKLSWYMGEAYGDKDRTWNPYDGATYPYRGAVRTFRNAIKKRVNAIMTEQVGGTNLGVKNGEATLGEIKEIFTKLNSNEEIGQFAEKVFATAEKLGVNIRFVNQTLSKQQVAGDNLGDMVEYKTSYFNDTAVPDQRKASTILHELIHACTVYVLDANKTMGDVSWNKSENYNRISNAATRLNRIYFEIQFDSDFQGKYGIKNVKEMVAELANEEFVGLMKKKNLWNHIVDFICELFGIDRGTSAYENARLCVDYILDNPEVSEYKAYANEMRRSARYNGMDVFGQTRYSERSAAKLDRDYMDALNRGDMETVQKLVDEAAKKAGYPVKAYHGTSSFGFTIFDPKMSDDKITLFFTDNIRVASTYAGRDIYGVKNIADAKSFKYERGKVYTEAELQAAHDFIQAKYHVYGLTKINVEKQTVTHAGTRYSAKQIMEMADRISKEGIYGVFLNTENVLEVDAGHTGWMGIKNPEAVEWRYRINYLGEGDFNYFKANADDMFRLELLKNGETVHNGTTTFSQMKSMLREAIGSSRAEMAIRHATDGSGIGSSRFDIAYSDKNGNYTKPTINTRELAKYAKKSGYSGVVIKNLYDFGGKNTPVTAKFAADGNGAATIYILFDSNQVKSADPVTYDDNGNVIPLSERFSNGNDDIRYSERGDGASNRSLLANAFETITKDSIEYKMIQKYKSHIKDLNALEKELGKLNAQIRDIRFTKGKYDAKKLAELEGKANAIASEINRQDRELLSLEASEPLRKVIERERKKEAQKTKDHVKEIQENKKARAEQTELRHKIRKAVRDLDKILKHGNKQKNVKEDLQPVVTKALQAADILFTDNYGNLDMLRNGIGTDMSDAEEKLVAACAKMLKDIDKMPTDGYESWQARQEAEKKLSNKMAGLKEVFARERKRLNNATVSSILGELANAYAAMRDSEQSYVQGAYSEPVYNFLVSLQSEVGGTIVKDMTKAQLESVYAAYKMVLESVRNANKMFNEELKQSREQLANAVIEEVLKAGGVHLLGTKMGDKISQFDWNNMKPIWLGDRIGSDTFSKLMNGLFKGQYNFAVDIDEAKRFKLEMDKKYHPRNWDAKKLYEFESSTGKKFSLDLQQIMSLYAFSKREQAYSHLLNGGFVFEENSTVVVDGKLGIKKTYIHKGAASYKVNEATLNGIINSLTAEQKAYVDEMQKYLSETMGAKGNEVSMRLYGIKMFNEQFYFPLRSSGAYMERAKEAEMKKQQGQINLVNSGFTHAVKPQAKNPIVLSGFMDVWAEHCNEMSMYHSMVLPMEDFRKVYNYTTVHDEKMESASVFQTIQDAYGKAATGYIDQLYKELNAGATVDPRETLSKQLISRFKKASVMLSASVVVQQFSAIGRAYYVIDPKYFIGAKVKSDTNLSVAAEMKKYAPVAIIKEMGGFDTGTKGSAKSYIMAEQYGKGERIKGLVKDEQYRSDIMGYLPAKADEKTWCAIWEAVKRETKAKNQKMDIKSEEFLKLAGERFSEVIEKTQVYDSVLARSANMRSKGGLMQMATAFMAEPTTTINLLENAIRGKNPKDIARAFGAVAVSIVLNNALASIVYAMRDDDEDETFVEKYFQSLTSGMIDDINPMSYYPFLKDVYSLFQGYDVERTDMSVIADIRDAMKKVVGLLGKDTSNMDDDELAAHNKQINEVFLSLLDAGCSAFGVPVKNIRRDVNGLINAFSTVGKDLSGERKTTWLSFWDKVGSAVKDTIPIYAWTKDEAKTDNLYDAIMAGDKAYLDRLKSGYKTEDAYHSAVRKALRENDSRIHDAAQARYEGRTEDYKRIFREIQGEGKFSFDDIMSAINSEESKIRNGTEPDKVSSDYTASGFVQAVITGNMSNAQAMKEDIISAKVANGKTQAEAEKEFQSSVQTAVGDAYSAGLLDEARAKEMLKEYAGKDEEEAASKVGYWTFCNKNPKYSYFTEANVNDYHEFAEPANISLEVFAQYINGIKGLETKYDDWGDVEVTKREQVLEVIDSLPLTWQQKDALYLAAGYAESKIWDVPW